MAALEICRQRIDLPVIVGGIVPPDEERALLDLGRETGTFTRVHDARRRSSRRSRRNWSRAVPAEG